MDGAADARSAAGERNPGGEKHARVWSQRALEVFGEMKRQGVAPNHTTFSLLLGGCAHAGRQKKAKDLFEEMSRDPSVAPHVADYANLIATLGKSREPDEAWQVVKGMAESGLVRVSETCIVRDVPKPNQVIYLTVIGAFVRSRRYDDAEAAFEHMLTVSKLKPTLKTVTAMVDVWGAQSRGGGGARGGRGARKLDADGERGRGDDTASAKLSSQFHKLRREYPAIEPDQLLYNKMMHVMSKNGDVDRMLAVWKDMEAAGVLPSVVTFNTLINGCAKAGDADKAMELMSEMEECGLQPDIQTFNTLIYAYGRAERRDEAYEVFEQAVGRGLLPDHVTFASLMNTFSESGAMVAHLVELEGRMNTDLATERAAAAHEEMRERPPPLERDAVNEGGGNGESRDGQYVLDLHGHARSKAKSVVLREIEWLRKQLEAGQDFANFVIITGVGKGSKVRGVSVLRSDIRDLLRERKIRFRESKNAGRVIVPREELLAYFKRLKAQQLAQSVARVSAFRYIAIPATLMAAYVVPKLTAIIH